MFKIEREENYYKFIFQTIVFNTFLRVTELFSQSAKKIKVDILRSIIRLIKNFTGQFNVQMKFPYYTYTEDNSDFFRIL